MPVRPGLSEDLEVWEDLGDWEGEVVGLVVAPPGEDLVDLGMASVGVGG